MAIAPAGPTGSLEPDLDVALAEAREDLDEVARKVRTRACELGGALQSPATRAERECLMGRGRRGGSRCGPVTGSLWLTVAATGRMAEMPGAVGGAGQWNWGTMR